jgi:hypothetical protein
MDFNGLLTRFSLLLTHRLDTIGLFWTSQTMDPLNVLYTLDRTLKFPEKILFISLLILLFSVDVFTILCTTHIRFPCFSLRGLLLGLTDFQPTDMDSHGLQK